MLRAAALNPAGIIPIWTDSLPVCNRSRLGYVACKRRAQAEMHRRIVFAMVLSLAAGMAVAGWTSRNVMVELEGQDRSDAELAMQAALENNPDGMASNWANRSSGNSGSTRPVATMRTEGSLCRAFETRIVVDDRERLFHQDACRQRDGTWRVNDGWSPVGF